MAEAGFALLFDTKITYNCFIIIATYKLYKYKQEGTIPWKLWEDNIMVKRYQVYRKSLWDLLGWILPRPKQYGW